MVRKSKQAGGNYPLTHYERTKKFASSGYGTTKQVVSKLSQYRIGQCALTTQPLEGSTALCSPSGHLYSESAILEYLLQTTRSLKQQKADHEQKQADHAHQEAAEQEEASKKRLADFHESQAMVKKSKTATTAAPTARNDLKRVSYWLSASQPQQQNSAAATLSPPPPTRPPSPHSGAPLRRKDLWPVHLKRNSDNTVVCAVSDTSLERGSSAVMAYWTDGKGTAPGELALAGVLGDVVDNRRCPLTDRKIRHVRSLFASGQTCERKQYKPTIT